MTRGEGDAGTRRMRGVARGAWEEIANPGPEEPGHPAGRGRVVGGQWSVAGGGGAGVANPARGETLPRCEAWRCFAALSMTTWRPAMPRRAQHDHLATGDASPHSAWPSGERRFCHGTLGQAPGYGALQFGGYPFCKLSRGRSCFMGWPGPGGDGCDRALFCALCGEYQK